MITIHGELLDEKPDGEQERIVADRVRATGLSLMGFTLRTMRNLTTLKLDLKSLG